MMNRLNTAIVLTLMGLLTLTACGGTSNIADNVSETANQAADQAKEVAGEAQGAAEGAVDQAGGIVDQAKSAATGLMAMKDSLPGMKDSVTAAIDAVKGGDFATAKTEVTKLQEMWDTVGSTVKEQSPEVYDNMSKSLSAAHTSLAADSPNKDEVVANLESMSKSVTSLIGLNKS